MREALARCRQGVRLDNGSLGVIISQSPQYLAQVGTFSRQEGTSKPSAYSKHSIKDSFYY